MATLWGVPVSIVLALILARGRFPGKALFDGLIHLPLVLPPVVTGYALLLLLGRKGLIGAFLDQHFGIVFAFRWTGAVVAAVVMSLPIIVRAIRLSIEAVDARLEQASSALGAGPFATFFLVTLPLSLPGILVGATLGFAKALGEFGATITFVSNIPGETRTIASAIYTASQSPEGDGEALLLSVIAALHRPRRAGRLGSHRPVVQEGLLVIDVEIHQRLGGFQLDVDFSGDGGVTALFGPSGSGKSSVIKFIAGLTRLRSGRIAVDGAVMADGQTRHVPPHRRRIGVVFQEARLFPHLVRSAQSPLRPTVYAPRPAAYRRGARDRHARHRAPARSVSGDAERRRAAARLPWPGATRIAAPVADGRAACVSRRTAPPRNPAADRSFARRVRHSDRLCQSRRRGGGAARRQGSGA